jgi:phosphotransferase system HPr (HPr) family protein
MIESDIEICNKLGLHARAASQLVRVSSQFRSNIHLIKNGRTVDAKSIMSLLMLGAGKGTQLSLRVEGADETAAHSAVVLLINNRFNEAE